MKGRERRTPSAWLARSWLLLHPENVNREEIAQACLDQAGAARLGSPMYEELLRRMAEDARAGSPCLAALEPHMPRSRVLAPLLLLAAIHRMVLEGRLPEAARFYPSAGGQADEDALWPLERTQGSRLTATFSSDLQAPQITELDEQLSPH